MQDFLEDTRAVYGLMWTRVVYGIVWDATRAAIRENTVTPETWAQFHAMAEALRREVWQRELARIETTHDER